MVKFDGYDIELTQGDTLALRIELDGRDLPEGTDGVVTIKKRVKSDAVVLQKRFDASDENLTVILSAKETNIEPGVYYWDVRLQIPLEGGGYEVYTPMEYASFVVLETVGTDIGVEGDPGMTPDLPVLQVVLAEARDAIYEAKAVAEAKRIPYGNTPFWKITDPCEKTLLWYGPDGDEHKLVNASRIMPCPKYLGFRLEGASRMFLYIGDLDAEGTFTPDFDYAIYTTSSGMVNYLNPSHNRILTVEEGKYFYFAVHVDEGYEIIGGDEIPKTQLVPNAHTPYFTTSSNGRLYSNPGYDSLFMPNGCYYMLFTENDPQTYNRGNMLLSTTTDEGDESNRFYNNIGTPSFGYLPKEKGSTLLRIPDTCKPEEYTLCLFPEKVYSASVTGTPERPAQLAAESIDKFRFVSQKSIVWSDSTRKMDVGKRFFGIPYSSRWVNSHNVGFEVSPETALNALNDEYSIAYDGGVESVVDGVATRHDSVSGKTEISDRGGPGYGLVCSSYLSLLLGCPYPQSNRGFSHDGNFALFPTTDSSAGTALMNRQQDHAVLVDEMIDSGYTVYEGVQPCCAKSVHTGRGIYKANVGRTKVTFLDDYVYALNIWDRSGYDTNLLNFADVEIPNGPVRPWRGHKAVYGPWDKSEKGSGIGITLPDGEQYISIDLPDDSQLNMSNTKGLKFKDITNQITQDGEYVLHGSTSDVVERFRYYNHDVVELSFDENGVARFSADDVLYAYVTVKGYGGDFEGNDPESEGPMVIAAGQKYMTLAKHQDRITDVGAAIVADPAEDSWGRYSVICTFVQTAPPSGGGDGDGGGLPTGGEPHQQLVTDADGNTVWEERTHYKTVGVVDILPETEITSIDPESGGEMVVTTPFTEFIVERNTYTVAYNGVEYECVASGMDMPVDEEAGITMRLAALGNLDAMMGTGDNGQPFVILCVPADMVAALGAYAQAIDLTGATSATLGISKFGHIVKKIDREYLPDQTHWTYDEDVIVLPETTSTLKMGNEFFIQEALLKEIVPYQDYTITFNGTEYVLTAVPVINSNVENYLFSFGNVGAIIAEATGDPFGILITNPTGLYGPQGVSAVVSNVDETLESVTVSIKKSAGSVEPIPSKYMRKVYPKFAVITSDAYMQALETGLFNGDFNAVKFQSNISLTEVFDALKSGTFGGVTICHVTQYFVAGNPVVVQMNEIWGSDSMSDGISAYGTDHYGNKWELKWTSGGGIEVTCKRNNDYYGLRSLIMHSSTKRFAITVNDNGQITATELT